MTIIDELTPIYYELRRVGIQRDAAASVIAIADLNIRNAACQIIATDNPQTTLTAGEKTALQAFLARELAVYETATSLVEWIAPPPPE